MLIKITAVLMFISLLSLTAWALISLLKKKVIAEQDIVAKTAARQYRLLRQIHCAYHAPYEDRPALIQSFKQNLNDFMADIDSEFSKLSEVNKAAPGNAKASIRIVSDDK